MDPMPGSSDRHCLLNLLRFTSIELVMLSSQLILQCPLLPPSIFPSIKDLSNEWSVHIRWPKYWSFSFSISPSSEYSGLISLNIHWFDLAVQGTFRSLLQHHSSEALIFWRSAFFTVQLSHPYLTTGKTRALTIRTCVSKVMSLLFKTLSRFATAFLPRSRCFLISWLQSLYWQWFWSPRRGNLSLLSPFPVLFAMQQWGRMPWSIYLFFLNI